MQQMKFHKGCVPFLKKFSVLTIALWIAYAICMLTKRAELAESVHMLAIISTFGVSLSFVMLDVSRDEEFFPEPEENYEYFWGKKEVEEET